MHHPRAVALVGKLGHGKTFLLNKVTGTRFPSSANTKSCTRQLQYGYSQNAKVLVIDTPGFYASDDVAAHIAAQKLALEGTQLSGIYVVIKFGRCDEIAETIDKIITFIGSDDVRVIITCCDTMENEFGYNPNGLVNELSNRIGIPGNNILLAARETDGNAIESFMCATLHEPQDFSISVEQVAAMSSLCVIARKYNKKINVIYAKIAAAEKECAFILSTQNKSYETDVTILTIQKIVADAIERGKKEIFVEAYGDNLSDEEQNLVYGKTGLSLSVKLRNFTEATNKLLSWDVTNPCDPRNLYRKCNFCGAIFNKTEGCDGETTCGAVPTSTKRKTPNLNATFVKESETTWKIEYLWNGIRAEISAIYVLLLSLGFEPSSNKSNAITCKPVNRSIESGCGATVSWSTMLPVPQELIEVLGKVDLPYEGIYEERSKEMFLERLTKFETLNQRILDTVNSTAETE